MKNKRNILPLAAFIAAYISFAAIPAYADAHCIVSVNAESTKICPDDPYIQYILNMFPSDTGTVSYIIDFLDYDGSLLDSKICQYGEKLENIITPGPREDTQYTYQFSGWDPQLPEMITESMAFIATYTQTAKDTVSGSGIQDVPDRITKASSTGDDRLPPDEITQVSSTSYDVTPFHVETPVPSPKATDIPEMTSTSVVTEIPETTSIPEPAEIPEVTEIPGSIPVSETTLSENHTVPAIPILLDNIDPVNVTETPAAEADIRTTFFVQNDTYTHDPYTERSRLSAAARTEDKIASGAAAADPTTQTHQSPRTATCSPAELADSIEPVVGPVETSESRFPLPVLLVCIIACGSVVWSKRR